MPGDNPTVHGREPPEDPNFHETGELLDGTPVGKIGALWYILDAHNNPISSGWHEIRPLADGGYACKIGARTARVTIENDRPELPE